MAAVVHRRLAVTMHYSLLRAGRGASSSLSFLEKQSPGPAEMPMRDYGLMTAHVSPISCFRHKWSSIPVMAETANSSLHRPKCL